MKVAALIIGIDGWEEYTKPLIDSIEKYEPSCQIITLDNASQTPYPKLSCVHRTDTRLCYSAAINRASYYVPMVDWLVILSNDVLCTGNFSNVLEWITWDTVIGTKKLNVIGFDYLEGWCIATPRIVFDDLNGWDENFLVSSWEDVDYSTRVLRRGYRLVERPEFPFVHLDQRQRFALPEFAGTHEINRKYFERKHHNAHAELH